MPVFASSFSSIGGGVISLGVGSSPPAGNFDITDTTVISNATGGGTFDFSYHTMPSAPRTFQNFAQSWGINGSSSNDGSSAWSNGQGGQYSLTHHTNTHNYFAYSGNNGVIYGRGDGSSDAGDWVVVDFYHTNNHNDYSGVSNSTSGRYMGGESGSPSGGTGGISSYNSSSARLRLWGHNTSVGWKLLLEHGMGTNGDYSHNHQFAGWWSTGNTIGDNTNTSPGTIGKRSEYDNMQITTIGYSASTA